MNEKEKIVLSGQEIVSLGASIAISLSQKYCKEDLKKLRNLFSCIASNITIIDKQ